MATEQRPAFDRTAAALGAREPETAEDEEFLVEPEEAVNPLQRREVENDDGSVTLDLDEEDNGRNLGDSDFDENLAEMLDRLSAQDLTMEFMDYAEQDIQAREPRDKQYSDGLKKAGLNEEDAKSGAEFDGASRVVHPMIAQACIDFQSRAIKELFPANGPVKTKIYGDQTEAKVARAERKREYMNWQMTTQITEQRAVLEKLLSQVPMAGAQYKRWWYDPEQRRPRTDVFYIDNVFLPFGATDFYTSPRVLYREHITREEFDRRVRIGLYRDVQITDPGMADSDMSATSKTSEKIEGASSTALHTNEDGLRWVYLFEANIYLEGDPYNDGRAAPYILHIDQETEQLLGVYRNWKQDDDRLRKVHWATEWSFIPWRDGPALGFMQIIGGLSTAATGSLRALLDAAHIANFPTAAKLKGGKTAGQNIKMGAGEMVEIAAPEGVMDPDIRKMLMQIPFPGPNATLYTLLEFLTQQAQGVVNVASEKIADAKADMPMGTALALIEHGSNNFAAIHARNHASMAMDLSILHRLNADNMSNEETVDDLGELIVYRADFEGPMDIAPVSDPNIFTEAQRYAQLQAVFQLKSDPQFAGFFKPDQLLGRALRLLNVSDIDDIANLPREARRLGAIDENYALATAERPLRAYQDQDHLEHLTLHVVFATSKLSGANPLIAGQVLGGMLEHCKEHLMMLWKEHMYAAKKSFEATYGTHGAGMLDATDVLMQAMTAAEQELNKELAQIILPGIDAMQQQAQQLAPKPQADPNVQMQENTKLEIAKLNDATKKTLDQAASQLQALMAQMEQASQAAATASTEKLAKLATAVDLIQQQQENGSKLMLQQLSGEQAEKLAALQAALAMLTEQVKGITNPEPTMDGPPDENGMPTARQQPATMMPGNEQLLAMLQQVVAGVLSSPDLLAPQQAMAEQQTNLIDIIQRERATNAAAFAAMQKQIAMLSGPRESRIEVGPDGQKRARSYLLQPPPVATGDGTQPPPAGGLSQ